jgi:hypothetical protein
MSKRKLTAGQTSVSLPIFIQDTTSSIGAGLSGLTSATSGLVAEWRRRGGSSWTAITLTSKTLGTWTSGGFVADGSLAGAYELDLPNAVCASGERWVAVRLYGAANMLPCLIEIELDAFDYQTASAAQTGDSFARLGAPAGASVSADIGVVKDETEFLLAVLAGAISDAQTSGESYTITRNGSTYTIDFTGLDSTGNRGGATLTKS